MAAGTQMKGAGTFIFYAGSAIGNGLTNGLLSVFTDVSNATPSAGGQMCPRVYTPIVEPEPSYFVSSGAYAGTYYINRNNTRGEVFYNNYVNTSGSFDIDLLHSYIHWPTDQRISIDVQSTSPFIWAFGIKIGGTPIIDISTPYNTSLTTYASLPSSAGAYSPNTINTGWTFTIGIAYDPSNPPGRNYHTFDIYIRDYHTADVIAAISRIVGDPSSGHPYSDSIDVYIDYWRCVEIVVNIHFP